MQESRVVERISPAAKRFFTALSRIHFIRTAYVDAHDACPYHRTNRLRLAPETVYFPGGNTEESAFQEDW
ncbi:hypothetical protein [Cyclobacterium xiamenense]|uniref:hypothetical protein n=1 Tax=Cyclobacterium xiamenense TaxID=1297121 RepID=UPI0012B98D4C|nr:hypothetical protein [Cyclobacterium xiamenense]